MNTFDNHMVEDARGVAYLSLVNELDDPLLLIGSRECRHFTWLVILSCSLHAGGGVILLSAHSASASLCLDMLCCVCLRRRQCPHLARLCRRWQAAAIHCLPGPASEPGHSLCLSVPSSSFRTRVCPRASGSLPSHWLSARCSHHGRCCRCLGLRCRQCSSGRCSRPQGSPPWWCCCSSCSGGGRWQGGSFEL